MIAQDQFKELLKLRNEIHRASYVIAKEAIHNQFDPEMAVQLRGSGEALIALAEELNGTQG